MNESTRDPALQRLRRRVRDPRRALALRARDRPHGPRRRCSRCSGPARWTSTASTTGRSRATSTGCGRTTGPTSSWMHHNTTQRIEIDGDEAWTETYCIATNRVPASDGKPDGANPLLRPLRAPRRGVADRAPEGRLLAEHGLDGVRGLAVRADAPARVARQKGSVVLGPRRLSGDGDPRRCRSRSR